MENGNAPLAAISMILMSATRNTIFRQELPLNLCLMIGFALNAGSAKSSFKRWIEL